MDIICFSHLRWDFVYQRPQHLMSRFARQQRVYFFEEPVREDGPARIEMNIDASGVRRITPHLPPMPAEDELLVLQSLLDTLLYSQAIHQWIAWYYTPMALRFSRHHRPALTVYDCMDELSAFRFAPPELVQMENELMQRAGVVFTGGQSLYEAKCDRHPNVYAFPSSVDVAHFNQARHLTSSPLDQPSNGQPRLGYFGVIDERLDLDLVGEVARLRPDWNLVMLGPTAKIDPAALPQAPNLHYLGMRPYADLPAYLAGWDVALMPFARNESTRYISPTKTPEYLAGGKPVVSTPIADVVRPYGEMGLVYIADTPQAFVGCIEKALHMDGSRDAWLQAVDSFLSANSWDHTWRRMSELIDQHAVAGD